MIIPAGNHAKISIFNSKYGLRLVTCRQGTYIELWDSKAQKPVKNGKLAMFNDKGELTLFTNVNPDVCETKSDGTIIIKDD